MCARNLAPALVAIMALVGCGGGGKAQSDGQANGGSGGAFATGVNSSLPLGGLSASNAGQLCEDVTRFFNTTLCQYSGQYNGLLNADISTLDPSLSDARLQMLCENGITTANCTAYDNCDAGEISENPSTCLATVADVVACLNDTEAALNAHYGSIPSCSSVTAARVMAFFAAQQDAGGGGYQTPTSCAMFESTCSGLSMHNIDMWAF